MYLRASTKLQSSPISTNWLPTLPSSKCSGQKEAQALTLTVTNQTAMFNVEKAVLGDGKLIVTLHGQGYHYLYKGTYEQAVANGDNRDNWIAGEQVDGQWQFTIPVAEGETYLPIVAISNSYLTKYEQGANTLERAFYPRQAVIDKDAATLVTGDYDHTADLTVSNSVKMFKVELLPCRRSADQTPTTIRKSFT